MGVELVFVGRQGGRYLLQRVHQMPPRSKKTLDGHFTDITWQGIPATANNGEPNLGARVVTLTN